MIMWNKIIFVVVHERKISVVKKIFLLVIICITIVLLGCDEISVSSDDEKEDDIVEIEFWYGLSGYSNQVMKELIEEFNSSQSKYYVTGVVQLSQEENFRALKSSIIRKKPPSVVLLENKYLYTLATKGVIEFLDDYFVEDDFIELYYNQMILQNRLIGLPMYGSVQVLYYRRDFFEDHSIKTVDLLTWESLFNVAEILTSRKEDETLIYGWESIFANNNLIDIAISNGGKFVSEDGKKVLINTDSWIESWEVFRKAIHIDKVLKINYGGEGRNSWYATVDDLMQGRCAGYIGSSGDKGDIDSSIIGTYYLPTWGNKLENPKGIVKLHSLAIPLDTKHEEKLGAVEWMKFLTNSDINLNWSIKTGNLTVRKSSMDKDIYYETILNNPEFLLPISQVKMGRDNFIDPTDGEIYDLLEEAAYKVLILNISSKEALDEAQKKAQEVLDNFINQGR